MELNRPWATPHPHTPVPEPEKTKSGRFQRHAKERAWAKLGETWLTHWKMSLESSRIAVSCYLVPHLQSHPRNMRFWFPRRVHPWFVSESNMLFWQCGEMQSSQAVCSDRTGPLQEIGAPSWSVESLLEASQYGASMLLTGLLNQDQPTTH